MVLRFLKKNIVSKLVFWHFVEVPQNLKMAFANFLRFGWHFFSVSFHLKTLFSHWHHLKQGYGKGFDPKRYAEAFITNTVSRAVGAVVRLMTILFGLVVEMVIFIGGVVSFLVWFGLPLISAAGLVWGIRFLI